MHGSEKQHVGCPHGPQGVQQQPLPNNETHNNPKPSQRAIMALFQLLDRGAPQRRKAVRLAPIYRPAKLAQSRKSL
jgi:hypothetical protein